MSDPFASPTFATAPSSSTPVRPARSTHRLSSHSVMTTRSLPLEDVPPLPELSTPASPASSYFTSPFSDAHTSLRTPSTPSRALPPSAYGDNDETRLSRKKSSTSIRRKPVPHHLDDIDLPTPSLPFSSNGLGSPISRAGTPGTPVTPTRAPPTYILPVDPPSYHHEQPRPQNQPLQHHQGLGSTLPPHDAAMTDIDTAVGADIISVEDLPRYAEQKETEPQTLARSLWKWGWLCPLLWAIGMCM